MVVKDWEVPRGLRGPAEGEAHAKRRAVWLRPPGGACAQVPSPRKSLLTPGSGAQPGTDARRLPKDLRKGNDTFLHYSQIPDSDGMKTKARRGQACRPKSSGLTLPFLKVRKWAWSVREEPQDGGDRGRWCGLTQCSSGPCALSWPTGA